MFIYRCSNVFEISVFQTLQSSSGILQVNIYQLVFSSPEMKTRVISRFVSLLFSPISNSQEPAGLFKPNWHTASFGEREGF